MANTFKYGRTSGLPCPPTTYRIQTPTNTLAADAKVCELLSAERREWKQDLIETVFNKDEAQLICGVPLSYIVFEDKLI